MVTAESVTVERAMTPQAYAQFVALGDEYEARLPADLRHAGWANERRAVETAYAEPNAAFIARHQGRPVGIVAFVGLDDERATVKKLYVSPAARTIGAARTLMTALEREAIRRGYAKLLLDTEPVRLEAAFRLYQSLGFAITAPFAAVDYADPVFMERRLPNMPDAPDLGIPEVKPDDDAAALRRPVEGP